MSLWFRVQSVQAPAPAMLFGVGVGAEDQSAGTGRTVRLLMAALGPECQQECQDTLSQVGPVGPGAS